MDKEPDRRGRTRVGYHGRAEIWLEGSRIPEAILRDISINGLFAETGEKAEIGRPCEVVILLGPGDGQAVRIEGRISRSEETGFAIEFKAIDPESYDHLRNIVLYNSPEPDRIEAELARPGIR